MGIKSNIMRFIPKRKQIQTSRPPQVEDPFTTVWRDVEEGETKLINYVREYTMTSVERMVSLLRSIEYIVNNNLEGDIVECGVWKGGSMMLIAKKLIELKSTEKKLFLFDTFEGMNEPGDADVAWDEVSASEKLSSVNKYEGTNVWCYSTLGEVKTNVSNCGYPEDNIFYIKGPVEQTLPYDGIKKISLLRLDTDWYESTKHELNHLYDKLVFGGILIIDDYGHWQGAQKAVDEFVKERNLLLFLNRIDYTGRLAVKNSQ